MHPLLHRLSRAFLVLTLLCPFRASAQIAPHPTSDGNKGIPLPELVAKATAVFEGKALEYRTFWNSTHTYLYTVATVEVYKVFKGKVAGVVEVATLGGTTADDAMGLVDGAVPIGNHAAGIFFAIPFEDATYKPAVPTDQVYQVVGGHEGLFVYNGIPPEQNAADTPHLRYSNIEKSLYPLLQEYTGSPYREFKPFNINRYNKILERRGINSQLESGATDKKTGSIKKKVSTSESPVSGNQVAAPLAASISGFSPAAVTAGTFTQLTITGSGFGNPNPSNPTAVPEVVFTDPSTGTLSVFTPRENFVSFNNTQIVIDVPSNDGSTFPHGKTAGTGRFQVFAADGSFVQSATPVTVTRSEFNYKVTTEFRQARLVDLNGNGGITFKYDPSLYNVASAVKATETALKQWRCGTSVNIGDDAITPSTFSQSAAECNITFVPASQFSSANVLMDTYKYYSFCNATNGGTFVYTTAIDIRVNQDIDWNFQYDTPPSTTQYDFKSVMLHELGHGIGLHHVIDATKVMHPFSAAAQEKFTLQAEPELNGASNILSRSLVGRTCTNTPGSYAGMVPLTVSNCTGATLSLNPSTLTPCNGSTVTLTASGATSYIWRPLLRFNPARTTASVTTSNNPSLPIIVYGTRDGLGDVAQVEFADNVWCPPTGGIDSRAAGSPQTTSVFPNPATANFTIDYQPAGQAGNVDISLHDNHGTKLRTFTFSQNSQRRLLPIQGLRPGLYIVRTVENGVATSIRVQVD